FERGGEIAIAYTQFGKQAHILDRDHRLVGEGLQQIDLRIGKRSRHVPIHGDRSNRLPVAEHRNGKDTAVVRGPRDILVHVLGILADVGHVDDAARQNGALRGAPAAWPARVRSTKRRGTFRVQVLESADVDELAVVSEDSAELGVAKTQRVGRDRFEDRLHIRWRAADDAQDLAGRGLLLQRFREVAIADFQLGEEAHVLDGDHRLIGERLQQLDLGVWKRLRHVPIHGNRSYWLSIAQHRYGKYATVVDGLCNVL